MAKPPHREMAKGVAFSAVVLCGGSSRRMGRDKAWVELNGRSIAERVFSAVNDAGAAPAMSVGGDVDRLASVGFDAYSDLHPGEGPLGGVITGLRASPHALTFVCAVDLPWLSAEVVRSVVAAATAGRAPVSAALLDRSPQLLTAAYRAEALPILERAFSAGERALWRAAEPLEVVGVTDLDSRALRDVDTPRDLRSG